MTSAHQQILNTLAGKSSNKQAIYDNTVRHFESIKGILRGMAQAWGNEMQKRDPRVEIEYKDKNKFECSLKFSGDTLGLVMHTNIFTFDSQHFVHQSQRVKENSMRAYFGQIQLYNFLSDSFKYNRLQDGGQLLARIFVDGESHFFVDGKQQFGFLYNNLDQQILNEAELEKILTLAVQYSLNEDLMAPPYEEVSQVVLGQFLMEHSGAGLKTAKRLGFMGES
ncbi:MAG: hypothetical protein RIT39_756 [Bacteroidota bacterium]|jgi:hypothetical protein